VPKADNAALALHLIEKVTEKVEISTPLFPRWSLISARIRRTYQIEEGVVSDVEKGESAKREKKEEKRQEKRRDLFLSLLSLLFTSFLFVGGLIQT
jgi:hypothetical protein